jgi:uncharacterized protein with PIN domain
VVAPTDAALHTAEKSWFWAPIRASDWIFDRIAATHHLSTVDRPTVTMLLCPDSIRNQTIREVAMATAGIVVCSSYGMSCIECNELLIAPRSSAHVSNYEVRNLWSCDNCGHETELAVNPRINAAPEPSKSGESSILA